MAALHSHTLATLEKHVASLEIWTRKSDLGLIMVHEVFLCLYNLN